MQKIKYYCDKCGKEIKDASGITISGKRFDFCEKHSEALKKVVDQWAEAQKEETKEQTTKEPEDKENAEAEKSRKPKTKKSSKVGAPTTIDWDKACALKQAGWTNEQIAVEVHASVSTINTVIYKKYAEYKNRKEN